MKDCVLYLFCTKKCKYKALTSDGSRIWQTSLEDNLEISELKMDISFDLAILLLGIYPADILTCSQHVCMRMFNKNYISSLL